MTIKELGEVRASYADCLIHEERGEWVEAFWIDSQKDDAREFLFDRCPREHGQYCWEVRINGRRGFLFCEYDDYNGIEGIRFMYRNSKAVVPQQAYPYPFFASIAQTEMKSDQ